MRQALQGGREFRNEREAYQYLERLRWPGGRVTRMSQRGIWVIGSGPSLVTLVPRLRDW